MGDKLSSLQWLPETVERPGEKRSDTQVSKELFNQLKRAFHLVLDAVFPQSCPVCGQLVQSEGGLCLSCWQELDLISAPVCERLGVPLHYELGQNAWSAAALVDPPDYDRARGAVLYNGPAQELIKRFKFYGEVRLSRFLSSCMLSAAAELVLPESIFVPVPLHTSRLRERTYNQSALLARDLAGRFESRVVLDGLARIRRTNQQVGLKKEARTKNVQNAFVVSSHFLADVYGAPVILVDDVLTTGATVEECTRVLQQAGASRVDVLVFALVDPERVSDTSR